MGTLIYKITIWIVITFIVLFLSCSYGASGFVLPNSIFFSSIDTDLFFTLRVPRVLLAFFLGAGLALSGSVLQTYFRNDLCCPYTLGVSGYASLGAVVGIFFNYGQSIITLCASFGALFALVIIIQLSSIVHCRDSSKLLLIGIALAFTSSSFVGLIQHLSDPEKLFIMSKWLQGGIEVVGYDVTIISGLALFVLFLVIFSQRKEMDLMLVSQEFALSRGVNIRLISLIILFSTSIFVGIITAFSGPIAFVGLFTPHIARRLFGALHKDLIIHSMFLGGCFLVIMDFISRIIIAPSEIPIGIVSGVIGAPAFIYLLSKQK